MDFESLWQGARPQVLAYCIRHLRDVHRAEDVTQKVSIRVWRKYSQFRGEVAIMGWILKIASREVSREAARLLRERAIFVDGSDGILDRLVAEEAKPGRTPGPGSSEIFACAVNAGEISEFEADILRARTANPQPSWQDIGRQFERSANACAAAHCRAIPRLRAFIFIQRPDWMGTPELLRKAFEQALTAGSDRLVPHEAEAFRMIVLEKRAYRRAGWQTALRSACTKVSVHLPQG